MYDITLKKVLSELTVSIVWEDHEDKQIVSEKQTKKTHNSFWGSVLRKSYFICPLKIKMSCNSYTVILAWLSIQCPISFMM